MPLTPVVKGEQESAPVDVRAQSTSFFSVERIVFFFATPKDRSGSLFQKVLPRR
jgi:hypothetical protein